jgi:hypothetical protein
MNHRLYEDWLFAHFDPAGNDLSAQQVEELESHLKECVSCQQLADSWRQVEAVLSPAVELRRPVMAEPAAGFTLRWQARLDAERARLHRRQALAVLAFYLSAAGLVFGSLLALAWPWLGSPQVLFWSWFYRLYTMLSYAGEVQEVLRPVLQAATGAIPFTGWVFLVGILCELGVLWIVSFRLITNPRRVAR